MIIRPEKPADASAIRFVTGAAFVGVAHSDQNEAAIVDALRHRGAAGCVVLGDPGLYGRFGFTSDHVLRYGGAPPEYFQSLVMSGDAPRDEVAYHRGFEAR